MKNLVRTYKLSPKILAVKAFTCLIMLLPYGHTWAQPENPNFSLSSSTFFELEMKSIALVDIETSHMSKDFSLEVPLPTEAGDGIGSGALATNSDNWINYSCAVPLITSRRIEVNISAGSIPSDFEVRLSASSASGAGGGNRGTPAGGTLTLSSSPQNIITGIRGSFTGNGPNNGHQLSYFLYYLGTNFDQLESQNINVSVLYTIVDN